MSSNATDRLTPEQKELWDQHPPHVPKRSGDQTPQQAINLGVLAFIFWCDFAGVGSRDPNEAAIRAEFEAAGVPELCPDDDFWELLRRNPGYPWILAPGANVQRWDFELFGRPNVVRMEPRGDAPESD